MSWTIFFVTVVCTMGALLFSPSDWGKWKK